MQRLTNFIKKRRLFFLLISFIFLLSSLLNENGALILWNKNLKLVWGDFKGKVDHSLFSANSTSRNEGIEQGRIIQYKSEMVAYCSHTIDFRSEYYKDAATFYVKNYFDETKSWKNTNSFYILNHEQRHFDLGELCARRFRKFLIDSISEFDSKKQNEAFSKYMQYDREEQLRYDSITNHSEDSIQQTIYDGQIDSLLNVYEDYSETKIKKKLPFKR